ncbi:MAG: tryptophan--tRNA ligase [Candidatus Omnitrophica bacterium]|nr:tryptophan--tRNA ligase [Candidatus Omnitrophota bacterium]
MSPKRVFSGMRPTGKLHLGHLVGALDNWITLQDTHQCVYSIVDWHALMGEYENSRNIRSYVYDMALDWLAVGIDPRRSIIFLQSDVPEHLELQMFLSCLTPLGWLERNPTYKEQLREITTRDLQTYAFLGYPVLQAADILLYQADAVPIGEDQLPHLELTREISRRFNSMYGVELFKDCAAILTPTPRLLGLDNRKMSKSYGNTINLSDSPEEITTKVKGMITDAKRLRLKDPGHPEECNVFSYYKAFAPGQEKAAGEWCAGALKGCTDCKKSLADILIEYLRPVREERLKLEKDRAYIDEVLKQGAVRAREVAVKTMAEVRKAVFS